MKENHSASAKRLLQRLHDGTITDAEEVLLLRWLNQYKHQSGLQMTDESLELATAQLKARLEGHMMRSKRRQIIRPWYWAAAACVVLLSIGIGIYLMGLTEHQDGERMAFDHDPGQNRAILVLEDGREIPLNGQHADLISTPDYEVRQTPDSGLVYLNALSVAESRGGSESIPNNTLQTPRGGQYRLVLPDGSQVWLNSDSRITYPVRFADTREVHVVGEAYFQIKRDADRPFIVHADRQRIDVLGTEFNVRAYPEQDFTETVLVSGSLRASSAKIPHLNVVLEPGQYAHVREPEAIGSGIANVAKVTAWRYGDFYFEDETLPEIMDVLSRWYDVRVDYQTDLSDKGRFGGVISRDKNLSAVLQMLESTGKIKFRITEKEVVLMD